MFGRVGHIFDELLARREREANIRYFEGLSDRVLRDIGVDRSEIAGLFDSAGPDDADARRRRGFGIGGERHFSPHG